MSNKIKSIYKKIPKIDCQGKCQQSCGIILMSETEKKQLMKKGIDIPGFKTHPIFGKHTCTKISDDGKCSIYKDRPAVCRLWGVVLEMPFPHNCTAEKILTKDEGFSILGELQGL